MGPGGATLLEGESGIQISAARKVTHSGDEADFAASGGALGLACLPKLPSDRRRSVRRKRVCAPRGRSNAPRGKLCESERSCGNKHHRSRDVGDGAVASAPGASRAAIVAEPPMGRWGMDRVITPGCPGRRASLAHVPPGRSEGGAKFRRSSATGCDTQGARPQACAAQSHPKSRARLCNGPTGAPGYRERFRDDTKACRAATGRESVGGSDFGIF